MNTPETDSDVMPAIDAAFLQLLQQHRSGQVLSDLSAAMRQATEAAQLQGKPAGITLKIVIKPAGNGSGAVVVADQITTKLPVPAAATSFFFADEHGNLLRNDPRQKELPLRAITGGQPVAVETLRTAKAAGI
jgi:hypothetical protein